jgi:hypothetical protein
MAKNTPTPAPAKRNPLIITIIILIAAVILGLVAYYASMHSAPATTPAPSPSSTASPSASPISSVTPSPTPTSTAAAGTPSECSTANLAGSLDARGGGTAGTNYQQLILTNRSTHACTVYGFPGVSLVDAAGVQLGSPAVRNDTTAGLVTLAPGQSAAAAVGFPDPGNFDPGTCSAPSTNLKVYPPNQTTALLVPLVARYCPGFSVQALAAH